MVSTCSVLLTAQRSEVCDMTWCDRHQNNVEINETTFPHDAPGNMKTHSLNIGPLASKVLYVSLFWVAHTTLWMPGCEFSEMLITSHLIISVENDFKREKECTRYAKMSTDLYMTGHPILPVVVSFRYHFRVWSVTSRLGAIPCMCFAGGYLDR